MAARYRLTQHQIEGSSLQFSTEQTDSKKHGDHDTDQVDARQSDINQHSGKITDGQPRKDHCTGDEQQGEEGEIIKQFVTKVLTYGVEAYPNNLTHAQARRYISRPVLTAVQEGLHVVAEISHEHCLGGLTRILRPAASNQAESRALDRRQERTPLTCTAVRRCSHRRGLPIPHRPVQNAMPFSALVDWLVPTSGRSTGPLCGHRAIRHPEGDEN